MLLMSKFATSRTKFVQVITYSRNWLAQNDHTSNTVVPRSLCCAATVLGRFHYCCLFTQEQCTTGCARPPPFTSGCWRYVTPALVTSREKRRGQEGGTAAAGLQKEAGCGEAVIAAGQTVQSNVSPFSLCCPRTLFLSSGFSGTIDHFRSPRPDARWSCLIQALPAFCHLMHHQLVQ